ncbi:hypothetical protein FEE95_21260 [Maribacter algarum]|uniref:Uncharacterized protein n=1 Tax=Maribacter algarum (ex Zhang et al. 2020) TaxID=2578118 RepID=A0A5S3PE04_9FLAO|nr:hypothetical protein [Maribacter algarum]TMM52218.1 hypothetical protein FEE95_21260 [Maribacter algarum]
MKKAIQFSMIFLLVLFTQSCETEIPPEDSTPPEFSFQITGDGLDQTFNQDTNFNSVELMLRRGTTYDFVYTGTDQGGMDRIAWYTYHNGRVTIETTAESPWRFRNDDPWNSTLEWTGDKDNPLTGSIATGSITTQGSGTDVNFRFSISDYGGESEIPNRIWEDLRVYVGAHTSRVRNR